MLKKAIFTLLVLMLLIPNVLAEEAVKDNQTNEISKVPEKQERTFVKQICSSHSLENDINEWIKTNPKNKMESVSYFLKDQKDCALIIFETEE